ncbi:MAG: DUF4159 domain-containing protein [Tepidisphaeraceae bacterium]
MTTQRRIAAALILACSAATVAPAATPDEVDQAIRRGVAFLYKSQNKFGNWEQSQPAPGSDVDNIGEQGQGAGRTSLCTYALLAAGERPLDPRIVKAVDWLRGVKITGNYAIGMRANVWFNLPQTKQNLAAIAADGKALKGGGSTAGVGFFDYHPGGIRTDMSCSQYGMLGAWAAAQRTDIFDVAYWLKTEASWCDQQNEDGGWGYNGRSSASTIQMTAAGVASLFIAQDFGHPTDTPPPANAPAANTKPENKRYAPGNIERGIAYLGQNLPQHLQNPLLYALYGIERVGVASGYKHIGEVDWYKACADAIIKRQRPDGSWDSMHGPDIDTAFALLFLARGRAPVMVNKLEFDLVSRRGAETRAADWNLRPRDMANVTRWVEERTERRLNWQVLKLNAAPIDDLHDAPILYMSGRLPVSLSDEDMAKLKQYVEEGGLIVASADTNNQFFSRTIRTLGETLFPGQKFEKLPDSHILLSGEQFPVIAQRRPVTVEGIGNGARLFMVLVPDGDLSAVYQRQDLRREAAYQFFANAFLYSVEKTNSRFKGQSHIVRPDAGVQPTKTAAVARLIYDDKADPEPGGWRRLAAVLHNSADIELTVQNVKLGTDPIGDAKIAHLTGTGAFKLTDAQRDAVKAFLDSGGLLVVDACGGSAEFDKAAQAELAKIDPSFTQQFVTPLPPEHPLFVAADGTKLKPDYRPFARPTLGPLARAFQLRGLYRGDKLAVVYSPYDLSTGLVGQSVDGILGYTPEVATTLMRRIIEMNVEGKL